MIKIIRIETSSLTHFVFCMVCTVLVSACTGPSQRIADKEPPNILFCIADDQSYPYLSFTGDQSTLTPTIDALAARGVLFQNAFAAAPQCSPSRAAILTGRNIWELEEAGTHSSYFPKKFEVFTSLLEENGYQLGFTGKPWGPGNHDAWGRNPVGPEFNDARLTKPLTGVSDKDYAANFDLFLKENTEEKPFFFWFGAHEPHRVFEEGSGKKAGKTSDQAAVPSFLPDVPIIRNDILDYSLEIEWYDQHLGKMLSQLAELGKLENTIVIVTADNGMAFPTAKANLYEYGTHVPLVIAGPGIQKNRVARDLVSLIDLAPTFLEVTGSSPLKQVSGRSLLNILTSKEGSSDDHRDFVLTGRERHTHARPDNLSYPARALRTKDYLYIHNFKPDRWPAGDPPTFVEEDLSEGDLKSMAGGYHDIDACPSKTLLLDEKKHQAYFDLAVAKRPQEQLFNISEDPGCIKDLSTHEAHQEQLLEYRELLFAQLKEQGDPRALGTGDIFESYPRFARMRAFPGFKTRGAYNPAFQNTNK